MSNPFNAATAEVGSRWVDRAGSIVVFLRRSTNDGGAMTAVWERPDCESWKVDDRVRLQMCELRKQWDRLYTECRPTFAKLKALPAEFDPVAMGC